MSRSDHSMTHDDIIDWGYDQVDQYEAQYPELYIIEPKENDCE